MDEEEAELAWRKAVARYQRRQGLEAIRVYLREHEPPSPREILVSPETMLWFKSLDVGPLDALDDLCGK